MGEVLFCPTCGSDNDPVVDLCHSCGAQLPPTSVPGEARKVVTILFADVTGSTDLADRLDPEAFRRMMGRYFRRIEAILHRHGGTVEKFIGDAVMAVFGIPRSHEDDAVRAVRAAVEIREAVRALNDEFQRSWGVGLAVRTGVNTGEVVSGEPGGDQAFASGDAVNVAARLEQAAGPGEILIGDLTHQLVRDAADVESVGPMALRGKSQPVPVWRLVDVRLGAAGWSRRLDSPLIGRDRELESLTDVFERTVSEGSCQVVTIMGPAGIGKSRLSQELVTRLGAGATVAKGRCLPYGDGVTFWPLVEVLRGLAGIGDGDSREEARATVQGLIPQTGDALGERITGLLGLGEVTPGIQETFWAVRRFVEQLATRRPVIAMFEDLHWAEQTLLDLLEYLADWVRAAPLLLVAVARPELLDQRPEWMAGKTNATLVRLEPLSDSVADGLISNLVGGSHLVEAARARIAQVAEGNPLFLEETLRMLIDDGLLRPIEDGWSVMGDLSGIAIPPTIHAVLTARLDRLEPEEREVIERASVIGRQFGWGAVADLSREDLRTRVGRHLQSLTRKELIRPDHSELAGEDIYRFTHVLVQDAAYAGIPKAMQAELHERLADRLAADVSTQAGEYEEIIGYHLEQAHRSLVALGSVTGRTDAVGERAASFLASAGRRAAAREDVPAAVGLLTRAATLLSRSDPERVDICSRLFFALMDRGDFERIPPVLADAGDAAEASGDPRLLAHVSILELWMRFFTDPGAWTKEAPEHASGAISVFDQHHDERGLTKAWAVLGLLHVMEARFGPAEEAWKKAAVHAHRADERRDELEALSWVLLSVWAGPAPAEQALERCGDVLERSRGDRKGTSSALFMRAVLEAGLGNIDEARQLIGHARSLLEEVAHTVWMAGPLAQMAGLVEMLAGDPAAAERELTWGYDTLQEVGEMAWLPTLVALLAEAVYRQGRYDDAGRFAATSEETAGSEDAYSQVLWRSVKAKVLARMGAAEEAEALIAGSVAVAEGTDSPQLRGEALLGRAEVLELSDRASEARGALEDAIRLFERKGNQVAARRAREKAQSLSA